MGSGSTAARPRLHVAWVVVAVLVLWRVVYHSLYLQDVPFALATFSDGRQYELAALDVLEHPPLGSKPFYLQGAYAYFMALAMALDDWVTLALLAQLVVAGATAWLFHRAAAAELGPRVGAWATAALLAYPMLAFYENKFLTAQLTVTACVLVLASAAWVRRREGWGPLVASGAALGLAVLLRPNLALMGPFAAWSIVLLVRARGGSVGRALGAWAVGLTLALAPMALRNAVVTDQLTVFPAHGGGTSFYIGNNAGARGVWNSAGGLLTGDVSRERDELRAQLGIPPGTEAQEAAAIGRALYVRAFEDIAADPGRWLWLELRKAWLLVGTDELAQDYDPYGEREMVPFDHRIGIPFGVLLVVGIVGGVAWWRRTRDEPERRIVTFALLSIAVATVAGNLLYFTSSQHRLPLVVPAAFLFPLGVAHLRDAVVQRRWPVLAAVAIAVALTFIPRRKLREPSGQHYYNLAVAWLAVDEPARARAPLDRAVELLPDHPVIRLERLRLSMRLEDFDAAREDLDAIERLDAPSWVRAAAAAEGQRLDPG